MNPDDFPAFPGIAYFKGADGNLHPSPAQFSGMSLRDYFAGQALAGMLAYPGDANIGSYHSNCSFDGAAAIAYAHADAMLKARGPSND